MGGLFTFGLGGLTGQAINQSRSGYSSSLRALVELSVAAEEYGFDSVWTSEHHFVDDGYLPSPLLPLAAIAARTERLGIGTQVLLAPLYPPVKLAEDVAVLDALSDGRVTLGLGLGYHEREYHAFGVPAGHRIGRLSQCIEVLRTAWSGAPVAIGKEGEPAIIRPLPKQAQGPDILLGAIAESGVRRAGRIGDGYVAPMMSLGGFARRLAWLEESARPDFSLGVYMHVFVSSTDAWARGRSAISYVEQQYETWQKAHSDFDQFRTVERADLTEPPAHVICGNPDEVAERLKPWVEALAGWPGGGRRYMITRLTYPGLPTDIAMESVRLFGSEVIPALRAGFA